MYQCRGGKIIRGRNATRPRFEIGVCNASRLRGLHPQHTASAKKISESANFREFFRFFSAFSLFFRVYPHAKNFIKI